MPSSYWSRQLLKLLGSTLWIMCLAWLAHHFSEGNTFVAGVQR